MAKHLLTQKRFLPYFCTQSLGVFNDNLYRSAFAILVTYFLAKENQGIILNIALVAFILPYFLFGYLAGQLADKYEKSGLIRKIKIAEIIIMLLGSVALYFQSVNAMLFILFALGTQSAFFGPIKYSILPQNLAKDEIMEGNAYVESSTFISILIGGVTGGFLASNHNFHPALIASLIVVSTLGWYISRSIPLTTPAAPNLVISFNIWTSTLKIVRAAQTNKPVFLSIIAISWFWFFGSVVLTLFPAFAKDVLGGDASVAISLQATFSIGIALGSIVCSWLSKGNVEIGLMPFGAIGMSVFTWLLTTSTTPLSGELRSLSEVLQLSSTWLVMFYMTMISFSFGMFIVPLYAFLQTRSNPDHRSRTIAVNNIFNSIFMVVAGGLSGALLYFEFSVLQIFKVVAVMNIFVVIYILTVVPEFFLRLVSWILVHSIYRIKKQGLQNIPKEGPALLVCNHVSFLDPPILLAVTPRPARFVMWYGFYELPVVKMVFKGLNSIPIGNRSNKPELVSQAFDTIAQALENGELVVIFPEGSITRDGEMNKFQPGIDDIIKRTPVPVVPLAIRGMWGTWLSRHKGRAMKGLPRSFMKKLTVVAGDQVPPEEASRLGIQEQVRMLRGDEK